MRIAALIHSVEFCMRLFSRSRVAAIDEPHIVFWLGDVRSAQANPSKLRTGGSGLDSEDVEAQKC